MRHTTIEDADGLSDVTTPRSPAGAGHATMAS